MVKPLAFIILSNDSIPLPLFPSLFLSLSLLSPIPSRPLQSSSLLFLWWLVDNRCTEIKHRKSISLKQFCCSIVQIELPGCFIQPYVSTILWRRSVAQRGSSIWRFIYQERQQRIIINVLGGRKCVIQWWRWNGRWSWKWRQGW